MCTVSSSTRFDYRCRGKSSESFESKFCSGFFFPLALWSFVNNFTHALSMHMSTHALLLHKFIYVLLMHRYIHDLTMHNSMHAWPLNKSTHVLLMHKPIHDLPVHKSSLAYQCTSSHMLCHCTSQHMPYQVTSPHMLWQLITTDTSFYFYNLQKSETIKKVWSFKIHLSGLLILIIWKEYYIHIHTYMYMNNI